MHAFDPRKERTSELLGRLAVDPVSPTVLLGDVLNALGVRGYGILIVLVALVACLPMPVGAGAIVGPLVGLLGVQMFVGQEHPWLPSWVARRGIARAALARFLERWGPWLRALEKLCRPRRVELFAPFGVRLTGLLVIGHGVVLALPIPLTNFPLAAVLVLAGIALVEDDGNLLVLSWALMSATIGAFLWFSDALVALLGRLIA